jgi:hypothetical protein
MTQEEAKALIISEVDLNRDSLLACVRMGEDPGTERMAQLISALATIFHSVSGQTTLDRNLAAALFRLGSDVPLTISSRASQGQSWRPGFMEVEVYELLVGVESIFEDRRMEIDEPSAIQ